MTKNKFYNYLAAGLLLGLIIIQLIPKTGLDFYFQQVGKNPLNIKNRLTLSQELIYKGQLDLAKQEWQKLNNNPVIKTISLINPQLKSFWQETEKIVSEPEKIAQEINHWQTILTQQPNYPDALMQASLLYLKSNQIKKAKEEWQKAELLDPNNEIIQKLGSLIEQEKE